MNEILLDIGIMIILATVLALISRLFKQPPIAAYVLAGVLIGPVLKIVTNMSIIDSIVEIGIAFLLFIVGLEMNMKNLKSVSMVSSVGGTLQVFFTFVIAYFTATLLHFSSTEAIYLGFAIAFSSTMVVVKILSDKGELQTLHGRIIVGILLMQDILAILALSGLTAISGFDLVSIFIMFAKFAGLCLLAFFAGATLFPSLFKFCAKSQELLFLTSVSTCLFFAIAFSYAGFSIAIGAFIAGLILANLPYNFEIAGRITPLKTFFATLFFVAIGAHISIPSTIQVLVAVTLLALVIIIKPLITIIICHISGYSKKTAFVSGIALGQISEFSIIIMAEGLRRGVVSEDLFSLTIILAVISITLSTYFLKFDNYLFSKFERWLGFLDWINARKVETDQLLAPDHEVLVCGYDRIGFSIVKTLKRLKKKVVVVDFDPELIKKLNSENIPALYGDISNPETIERLHIENAKLIVSTVPSVEDNTYLIKQAKKHKRNCVVMVTAERIEDALDLYREGADYVILPHFLGASHASVIISKCADNENNLIKTKMSHIQELSERLKLGHEHPQYIKNGLTR